VNPNTYATDRTRLRDLGVRKVVVVGPKNFGYHLNWILRVPAANGESTRTAVRPDILEQNDQYRRAIPPGEYVDVLSILSGANASVPTVSPNGYLMSEDAEHLTRAGAQYLGEQVFSHPLLHEFCPRFNSSAPSNPPRK
jgi:hypothetical protein